MDNAFSSNTGQLSTKQPFDYSFENKTSSFLNSQSNKFSDGTLNINSIEPKFFQILFILQKQLLDILKITESKLSPQVDSSHFESLSYDIIRRDRLANRGGGIIIFIKKNINRSDETLSQAMN